MNHKFILSTKSYSLSYTIQVNGQISSRWETLFEDLVVEQMPDFSSVFKGTAPDQATLFGVLMRLYSLGMQLISVQVEMVELIQNTKGDQNENFSH